MKTRIEIWVDVEIPMMQIEQLRQVLEDGAWDAVNDHRRDNLGSLKQVAVQANEIFEQREGWE
jgi:hypothetical protein